jgi:hypothetical protein
MKKITILFLFLTLCIGCSCGQDFISEQGAIQSNPKTSNVQQETARPVPDDIGDQNNEIIFIPPTDPNFPLSYTNGLVLSTTRHFDLAIRNLSSFQVTTDFIDGLYVQYFNNGEWIDTINTVHYLGETALVIYPDKEGYPLRIIQILAELPSYSKTTIIRVTLIGQEVLWNIPIKTVSAIIDVTLTP